MSDTTKILTHSKAVAQAVNNLIAAHISVQNATASIVFVQACKAELENQLMQYALLTTPPTEE